MLPREGSSNEPISMMWTQTAPMLRPGLWSPDHFVPCISVQAANREASTTPEQTLPQAITPTLTPSADQKLQLCLPSKPPPSPLSFPYTMTAAAENVNSSKAAASAPMPLASVECTTELLTSTFTAFVERSKPIFPCHHQCLPHRDPMQLVKIQLLLLYNGIFSPEKNFAFA